MGALRLVAGPRPRAVLYGRARAEQRTPRTSSRAQTSTHNVLSAKIMFYKKMFHLYSNTFFVRAKMGAHQAGRARATNRGQPFVACSRVHQERRRTVRSLHLEVRRDKHTWSNCVVNFLLHHNLVKYRSHALPARRWAPILAPSRARQTVHVVCARSE